MTLGVFIFFFFEGKTGWNNFLFHFLLLGFSRKKEQLIAGLDIYEGDSPNHLNCL
jgi:hypothetical protein